MTDFAFWLAGELAARGWSEAELADLRTQLASLPVQPALFTASPEQLHAFVDRLCAGLVGAIPQQRHVLRQVVDSLTYGPHLTLTFRVPE